MMTSPTEIYRDTLYEEVWQFPMIEVGKRYGISRPAVKWACLQLQVPLPPQGFWAARAAGRPPSRAPLPPPILRQPTAISLKALVEKFTPHPHRYAKGEPRRSLVERVFGIQPSQDEKPFAIEAALPEGQAWHSALKPLKNMLEKQASDAIKMKKRHDWELVNPGKRYPFNDGAGHGWSYFCDAGQILDPRHRKFATRLTLTTYQRGLLLLNAVLHDADAKGFRAKINAEFTSIHLTRNGVIVDLRLVEKLRATYKQQSGRSSLTLARDRVLTSSGRLELHVTDEGFRATVIKDEAAAPIENQRAKIFDAIEFRYQRSCDAIEKRKIDEAQRRVAELKSLEEAKRREEEKRKADEERKRRELLAAEVENWRKAESLRLYLSDLDRRIQEGEVPAAGYEEWRSWAESVLDDLDSLRFKNISKG